MTAFTGQGDVGHANVQQTSRNVPVLVWLLTIPILGLRTVASRAHGQRRNTTGAPGTPASPAATHRRARRSREAAERSRSTDSRCSTWGSTSTQINPNWYDTLRVTRLPSFEDQFGEDGRYFAGVRQSRLGFRSSTPTTVGELEDDLRVRVVRHWCRRRPDDLPSAPCMGRARRDGEPAGTGVPLAIRTRTRTRLEDRGPNWYSLVTATCSSATRRSRSDTSNLMVALARPGASGDQGVYADRVEPRRHHAALAAARFCRRVQAPRGDWGYVRAAGILRRDHSGTIPATTRSISPATRPGGA